jgi:hypothetical protein
MTHDHLPDEGSLTDEETIALETIRNCPWCGGCLDSGLGFGRRDLECSSCEWNYSYPADHYFNVILDRAD